jgi:hypothetical protein
MASTQTPASPDATGQNTAIAGLDSLELRDITKGRDPARIARKAWSATWPKLLAIGLVLGAWQLFYLSNFHGDRDTGLVKGPGAGLANLWDQTQHAQLWQAIGTTVRTAVIGYLLAMLISSSSARSCHGYRRCARPPGRSSAGYRRCRRSPGSLSRSSCSALRSRPSCS